MTQKTRREDAGSANRLPRQRHLSMSTEPSSMWICCQLGAREHYAIPRALHTAGQLDTLFTDLWFPPGSPFTSLSGTRLRDRFHPDLFSAHIESWNWQASIFEWRYRRRLPSWNLILHRNHWFQSRILSAIGPMLRPGKVIFSYSYTARRLFQAARAAGCRTILGQIDPGPEEERLVSAVHAAASPEFSAAWQPAPPLYWRHWAEECTLADTIIVNSEWSRQALATEGIPTSKIRIVPLAYQSSADASSFTRTYPEAFSSTRPLRVLFLGQVNLRKGVGPILDSLSALQDLPLRIQFVGPIQIPLSEFLRTHPQLEWVGPVSRGTVASYYREADVFLFPTLSDGFGITQLEAQAWRLPIIASHRCGQVVEDGRTGWILDSVTPESIGACLRQCAHNPATLNRFSAAISPSGNSIDSLSQSLLACAS